MLKSVNGAKRRDAPGQVNVRIEIPHGRRRQVLRPAGSYIVDTWLWTAANEAVLD